MIVLLCGDNSFEIEAELASIKRQYSGDAVTPDVDKLSLGDVRSLITGVTLFGKRLVVLRGLSERTDLWKPIVKLLCDNGDKNDIVLVERKRDKRTAEYKMLQKKLDVREFKAKTDRDAIVLATWIRHYAKDNFDVVIEKALADYIIDQIGYDQWQLVAALERLQQAGEWTKQAFDLYAWSNPTASSFALFDAMVQSDAKRTDKIMRDIRQDDDPYMLIGLLASQAVALLALKLGHKSDTQIASDLSASSYMLGEMSESLSRISTKRALQLIDIIYDADLSVKTNGLDPWNVVDLAVNSALNV